MTDSPWAQTSPAAATTVGGPVAGDVDREVGGDIDVEGTIRQEAPDLLAFLVRRTTNTEDAADLLAEVLLVAWRRVDVMPAEPRQARMWLFGIARKTLLGYQRGSRRRGALTNRLEAELQAGSTAGLNGDLTRPEDDRTDGLVAALAKLPSADREIIKLTHWDDFSLSEAAQHLHLRPATARSRYHRARRRLRQALDST